MRATLPAHPTKSTAAVSARRLNDTAPEEAGSWRILANYVSNGNAKNRLCASMTKMAMAIYISHTYPRKC
jgi:hypothetical protein